LIGADERTCGLAHWPIDSEYGIILGNGKKGRLKVKNKVSAF
jgi:hypothetical protein